MLNVEFISVVAIEKIAWHFMLSITALICLPNVIALGVYAIYGLHVPRRWPLIDDIAVLCLIYTSYFGKFAICVSALMAVVVTIWARISMLSKVQLWVLIGFAIIGFILIPSISIC